MRSTVGQMMIAVALTAFLIPFTIDMILLVLFTTLVFWLPVLFVARWCDDQVARWPIRSIVLVAPFATAAGFWTLREPTSWRSLATGAAFGTWVVAQLLGPAVLARRIRRGESLASGHLLWCWSGLLTTSQLFYFPHPHQRVAGLQMLVEGAQLTLVIVVLLALYGSRPVDRLAAWKHHAGWVLVEFDVILWGWYAAQFLR
ncbi:hypothetical protein P12x_003735 [Tundrisphaera lichenicola]|uniref:hypothetical protein n=1 Tax=Tundrisphaera lichenicola TaxID=2029860 RepID=UPI003EC13776